MAKIYTDTKAQRAAKAAYDALPIEKKNVVDSENVVPVTEEQIVMEEVTPVVTEVVEKVKKQKKTKKKKKEIEE